MFRLFFTIFLIFSINIFSQKVSITGSFTDPDDRPLAGALIWNTTTDTYDYTDFYGNYSISASLGDIIRFQEKRFGSVKIPIRDRLLLNRSHAVASVGNVDRIIDVKKINKREIKVIRNSANNKAKKNISPNIVESTNYTQEPQITFNDPQGFIKDLIVFQTLIAENRIDEFSSYTSKMGYVAGANNSYIKMDIKSGIPEDGVIIPIVALREYNSSWTDAGYYNIYLYVQFMVSDNNSSRNKYSKNELTQIYSDLKNSIEVGLPYNAFLNAKKQFSSDPNETIIEDGKYVFSVGNYTLRASNFNNLFSTSKDEVFTFTGPGKLSWIEIVLERIENVDDGIAKIIVRAQKSKADFNKPKMNVDFFSALKNFNDRIWSDN